MAVPYIGSTNMHILSRRAVKRSPPSTINKITMKGFELIYKNDTKYIASADGIVTIYLSTLNNEHNISVSGIDYSIEKKVKWLFEQMETGDTFHIRFADIEKSSAPVETSNLGKDFHRKTKLEQYRHLQEVLIRKGIL